MRAPIMAAVFAFELTGDGNALLPLLATSAVAYGFTVLTMGRSILTEKIARRGYHIYREYGIDPLERNAVEDVMTSSPLCVDASHTVARVLESHFGADQPHRAFPVLRDGDLVGMLDRDALEGRPLDMPVGELFGLNYPVVALAHETCRSVAIRLAVHKLERLPVVAGEDSRELVGLVSRSDLIKAALSLHADEHERRVMRRTPLADMFDDGSRA
jgi:CBS domain-containing protein